MLSVRDTDAWVQLPIPTLPFATQLGTAAVTIPLAFLLDSVPETGW